MICVSSKVSSTGYYLNSGSLHSPFIPCCCCCCVFLASSDTISVAFFHWTNETHWMVYTTIFFRYNINNRIHIFVSVRNFSVNFSGGMPSTAFFDIHSGKVDNWMRCCACVAKTNCFPLPFWLLAQYISLIPMRSFTLMSLSSSAWSRFIVLICTMCHELWTGLNQWQQYWMGFIYNIHTYTHTHFHYYG